MKSLLAGMVAFAATLPASTAFAADVDVHINVVPPVPVITFEAAPEVIVVPGSHVYYAPAVPEYDVYRYGKYWYVNRDGYWYRSHGHRGPFKAVDVRRLPRDIVVLPTTYRHHPLHPRDHDHGKPKKHKHHKDKH